MASVFFKVAVRVPKVWRNSRNIVAEEIRDAVKRGSDLLLKILKERIRFHGAVATRDLVNGAASRVVRHTGVTAWYTRELFFRGPAESYWEFVDKRRRAGKMPIRKVGDSWEPLPHVARYLTIRGVPPRLWFVAIRQMARGFPGYHFVAETVGLGRPQVRALIDDAIKRVRQRMGG